MEAKNYLIVGGGIGQAYLIDRIYPSSFFYISR